MIVPILERPTRRARQRRTAIELTGWTDGDDPYAATAALLEPEGRYGLSDSAWAMHVLGLQRAFPGRARLR